MMNFFAQTDAVGIAVAIALLLMSIASWVVIFWKIKVLWKAKDRLTQSIAAFWQSPDLGTAKTRMALLDKGQLTVALIDAKSQHVASQDERAPEQSALADQTEPKLQLTRLLRQALNQTLTHLQWGQVLLATVGATAPFVGLFGTVWGIYHALVSLGGGGQFTMERVSGPVGEALIMTAAGLAVAIPAVMAYNAFGRRIKTLEIELEGFAHDLLGLHGKI